jgi:hypothetical protein
MYSKIGYSKIGSVCLVFGLLAFLPGLARADDDLTPFEQSEHFVVTGTVQSVSDDRMIVGGNDDHRYVVDAYGADVTLSDSRPGEPSSLTRGMKVRVAGTLLGRNLLEADHLNVIPEPLPAPAPVQVVLPAPPPVIAGPQFTLDAFVRDVDTAHDQVTLLGDDDKRYTADTRETDIILRGTERSGLLSDLSHGMRVHLVGVLQPGGLVEADRIRVLPAPELSPAPVIAPAVVTENMDAYTGILIDCRSLPDISRSPAPAIYATAPDATLLYPDRSHVPTPDEVQEESIVRYYWTVDSASGGVGGANPLILTAQAVVGPAKDAVQLAPEDAARFQILDKRLHFTRTWKVGFLMPADH